jgi:hypothetical protein
MEATNPLGPPGAGPGLNPTTHRYNLGTSRSLGPQCEDVQLQTGVKYDGFVHFNQNQAGARNQGGMHVHAHAMAVLTADILHSGQATNP